MTSYVKDVTTVSGALQTAGIRPAASAIQDVAAGSHWTIIPAAIVADGMINIDIHIVPTAASKTPSLFTVISLADGSGTHTTAKTAWGFTIAGSDLPRLQLINEASSAGASLTAYFTEAATVSVFARSSTSTLHKTAAVQFTAASGFPLGGSAVFDTQTTPTGNMVSGTSTGSDNVPVGGEYSELLSKSSATDYDVGWNHYWNDHVTVLLTGTNETGATMAPVVGSLQAPTYGGTGAPQSMNFSMQMPHGWVPGTDVYPHIHIISDTSGALNTRGQLVIAHNTSSYGVGTMLYAGEPGYIDVAGTTTLASTGGKEYAYYYNPTIDVTLIYSTATSCYVLAQGDYTAAGAHPAPAKVNLTSNNGTLLSGVYYPTTGAWVRYTLGPYITTGGTATTYAYAQIDITSGPAGSTGTYNYIQDNIYVSGTTNKSLSPDLGAGPYYSAYYCHNADKTIVWHTGEGCYVLMDGNIAVTNIDCSTLAHVPLTLNLGAPDPARPAYYHPTPLLTFGTIDLSDYTAAALGKFLLEYSWANISNPPAPVSSAFPVSRIIANSFTVSTNPREHTLVPFPRISGAGQKRSSVLIGKITRTPADQVDYLNFRIQIASFDFHIQLMSIGYGPDQNNV